MSFNLIAIAINAVNLWSSSKYSSMLYSTMPTTHQCSSHHRHAVLFHTLLTINTHTGVAAVFCCMSVHKLIKRSAVGTRHKMTIKLSKLVRPMQGSVTSYNAEWWELGIAMQKFPQFQKTKMWTITLLGINLMMGYRIMTHSLQIGESLM